MSKEQQIDLSMIAGPCAAESEPQVLWMAKELKKLGITTFRACAWKPRTSPGFEGVGEAAIPWLAKVSQMGMTVGSEVMMGDHVTQLAEGILKLNDQAQIIMWLGSRNQNHQVQRDIGRRLLDTPSQVKLLVKNQPWNDERHWRGILDHLAAAGVPSERIILCHRGHSPHGLPNPHGLRNLPDFDQMARVKIETGRPMVLDLSHIAGTQTNVPLVLDLLDKSGHTSLVDGLMVETHPDPKNALTDQLQQLDLALFKALLQKLDAPEEAA